MCRLNSTNASYIIIVIIIIIINYFNLTVKTIDFSNAGTSVAS